MRITNPLAPHAYRWFAIASLVFFLATCRSSDVQGVGQVLTCMFGSCPLPPPPATPYVTIAGPAGRAGWDSLQVGKTMQLSATLRDTLGSPMSGRTFAWRSETEPRASVSATGLVTANAPGTAEIIATAMPDAISGFMGIVIMPGPVASLAISPDSVAISQGESRTLTAAALDSFGFVVPSAVITWSSDTPSIATVSSLGVVSAITTGGPVRVTATSAGKSASAKVMVTAATSIAFTRFALSRGHTCALTTTGQVYCWGANAMGQLGDGTRVDHLTIARVQQDDLTFTDVVAGVEHTCALSAGQAYCWGSNYLGQLGDGTNTSRSTPAPVNQLGATYNSLVAGDAHTCGLTGNGDAYCWGAGSPSQVTPLRANQGTLAFTTLAAAGSFTCGLTSQGQAYCWGENSYGQVGDGTRLWRQAPTPVLQGAEVFAGIAAGAHHACGLTPTGRVICWGTLASASPSVPFPSALPPSGEKFVALAGGAGDDFQCALVSSNRPACWGKNQTGQLGVGNTTDLLSQAEPVLLQGETAAGVAIGQIHACAWTLAGKGYCWGGNFSGQLGDGTQLTQLQPVRVKVP